MQLYGGHLLIYSTFTVQGERTMRKLDALGNGKREGIPRSKVQRLWTRTRPDHRADPFHRGGADYPAGVAALREVR